MALLSTQIWPNLKSHSLFTLFSPYTEKWPICRLRLKESNNSLITHNLSKTNLSYKHFVSMASCSLTNSVDKGDKWKRVWIWTESKEVMTASVERGWNTFVFSSQQKQIANDWMSIAKICPLFIEDGEIIDSDSKVIAKFFDVSEPQELEHLRPDDINAQNVVVNFLDWQIIPAENIIAKFQNKQKTLFGVSKSPSEAQVFLEVLEHGLEGIVLKVDDVEAVLKLKEHFDRRSDVSNLLNLSKAIVTRVQTIGMGDRVCVDLCCIMKPGEGLLVGSYARGLFLVHSECLESNYIASRPFRVNAGPVHAYVAIPGGKTCYLSELRAGKEVIVVDPKGHQRTAFVGRVKIETRPLILVEAKITLDDQNIYSIFLQNAETVALLTPVQEAAILVTKLKVGDEVLLKLQGGARHTGIEIQEFIVEN